MGAAIFPRSEIVSRFLQDMTPAAGALIGVRTLPGVPLLRASSAAAAGADGSGQLVSRREGAAAPGDGQ